MCISNIYWTWWISDGRVTLCARFRSRYRIQQYAPRQAQLLRERLCCDKCHLKIVNSCMHAVLILQSVHLFTSLLRLPPTVCAADPDEERVEKTSPSEAKELEEEYDRCGGINWNDLSLRVFVRVIPSLSRFPSFPFPSLSHVPCISSTHSVAILPSFDFSLSAPHCPLVQGPACLRRSIVGPRQQTKPYL